MQQEEKKEFAGRKPARPRSFERTTDRPRSFERTTDRPRSFERTTDRPRWARSFGNERRSPRRFEEREPRISREEFTTPYVQPVPTGFTRFNLKRQLQKAIDKLGYTTPTQIQSDVWEAAMSGTNIVWQSQTGTGKTTAFLLPILQKIDSNNRYPQVLIVAPTRELVQQIRDDIKTLTTYMHIKSMILIGGKSIQFQKDDLKYGPQFIVATPGRLIDFMQKRYIDVSKIDYFVLDEVDRMLDMGFIEDVDRIRGQLENLKQTMTFSATINPEIKNIIGKHCPEYKHIRIWESVTVDKIDHTYIEVPHSHKFATLVELIHAHEWQKILIFSQTKRNTEVLAEHLWKEKINGKHVQVGFLNGDLDMRHRTRTLRDFKEGVCNILITTDVAARWLNMDNVQLVINFDVPREPESYVHRIGRTWRAGAEGKAIMLVDADERHLVMGIEKEHKIKLQKTTTNKAVLDKSNEYSDIKLDRPLPPSEKKRRMVARSISANYGRERNDYKRGGRDEYKRSGSRPTSRFGDKNRDEKRSFGDRQYSRKPEHTAEREDRTYGSRKGTFEKRSTSRSQFDNKPERVGRRIDNAVRKGSSRASSIGGYDVDFFNAQRKQEQEKFIRKPNTTRERGNNRTPYKGWSEKSSKARLSTRR